MESKTKTVNTSFNVIHVARVAKQERAIRRAVLHNVEHGITDIPAHGILHLPGKNYKLLQGTLDLLNEKLQDYEVRVDAYKLKIRNKYVDRIAVTHLDKKLVEPSPAYQTALQSRYLSARAI